MAIYRSLQFNTPLFYIALLHKLQFQSAFLLFDDLQSVQYICS